MTNTIDPPREQRAALGFTDLGVPPAIAHELERQHITLPTPIQSATLPPALAGRDVLGQGQTGTGKTLAFAIPTLLAVSTSARKRRPGQPRAMVLVPTRELATQVAATFTPIAKTLSLTCATIFGGVPQGKQVAALRSGVDVIIACPGRLEDLVKQGHCSLGNVAVTVLDEADHLSDLGFLPAVRRLLGATPERSQRLLFSATLDATVEALVRTFLRDPAVHSVAAEPESSGDVVHHLLVLDLASKFPVIREIVLNSTRSLLFTRTKHGARKLTRQLCAAGINAVELHGNLSQGVRQRNLDAFSRGDARVLVATDIAARGVHVDDIDIVVHVDVPAEHKTYVHRSGRTARAGANGVVATLTTTEQLQDARRLARAAGIDMITDHVGPGHPVLGRLGEGTPTSRTSVSHAGARPQAVTMAGRPAAPARNNQRRRRSRVRS